MASHIRDHSSYPGALVAPDGEIYFRRTGPPEPVVPELHTDTSSPDKPDQPDNSKDSQQ